MRILEGERTVFLNSNQFKKKRGTQSEGTSHQVRKSDAFERFFPE
jgi:hypothetical protein